MTQEKDSSVLSTKCPQCSKEAKIIQLAKEIPFFGKIMLQTMVCEHCGFKFSDAMSLEFNNPKGFEVKIETVKDLETKLVRNSSGTIEIPELGMTMEPGPFAEGFYTNIEGLLERFEEVLAPFLESEEENQQKMAEKIIELLKKCKDAELSFTVRLLDPFGGSALIGKKVKQFELSKKEAERLKKGIQIS
jgi:zinc finger protein